MYYGAERGISRYGTGRHEGETDERGTTATGEIDPGADVRPGGRQRAFVNWDAYDEAHLAFYERLIDRYHDISALHADAELCALEPDPGMEVTSFVRDAGPDFDGTGPGAVLVVVNFEAAPVEVDLPPGVGPTDLLRPAEHTGSSGEEGSTVLVDVVGVFSLERSLEESPEIRTSTG